MVKQIPLVVLTGGVASGKTAVSDRLAQIGIPVIDTDEIARELTAPGRAGYNAVVQQWGPEMLQANGASQGALDRRKLRELIFSDPAARHTLESILHPMIMHEVQLRLKELEGSANTPYAVVVIPLYAENRNHLDADAVVVVDVPESEQLRRLIQRDTLSKTLAKDMMAAQASRQHRLALATEVIQNTGTLEELNTATDQLHRRLVRNFSRTPPA